MSREALALALAAEGQGGQDGRRGPKRVAFVRWVEGRFFEEAKAGRLFMVVDGSVRGDRPTVVADVGSWLRAGFSGGGWERWVVSGRWTEPDAGLNEDPPYVSMVRLVENDRGPADAGPVVAFPLSVLFGEKPPATLRARLTSWMRRRNLRV